VGERGGALNITLAFSSGGRACSTLPLEADIILTERVFFIYKQNEQILSQYRYIYMRMDSFGLIVEFRTLQLQKQETKQF
jgi:hypothetical protein